MDFFIPVKGEFYAEAPTRVQIMTMLLNYGQALFMVFLFAMVFAAGACVGIRWVL
jgi:hypothetical protein